MNPQPVSLADEVRKWWERIHHYLEHQSTPKGLPIDPPILKGCSQEIWDALEVMDYKTFLRAEELLSALLAQHAVAEPQQKPWLYAIQETNAEGVTSWHDGEQCVFGDRESAQDEVDCLNDPFPDGENPFQIVPLYRLLTSPVAPPPPESMQMREWRVALQRIANDDDGSSVCHCECGDDENCCEKVDVFCPHCIAQTVLQKSAPVAPPPPVYFSNSHAVWDVSKIPAELVYPSPAVPADYHCTFCDGNHFENLCPNRCKPEDAAPPVAPGEQPTPRERT